MTDKTDATHEAICKMLRDNGHQLRDMARALRDRTIEERESRRKFINTFRVMCAIFTAATLVVIVAHVFQT